MSTGSMVKNEARIDERTSHAIAAAQLRGEAKAAGLEHPARGLVRRRRAGPPGPRARRGRAGPPVQRRRHQDPVVDARARGGLGIHDEPGPDDVPGRATGSAMPAP